ncbi:hypothetical protein M2390_000347 [Mycetocola sp. BIGb0189]|uniref:nucleotidyl transferase AbiEii/AbiGii toxin family protein n=1 Tax=Mycetocola sp. BIGb0189 TaxID=2940604 RepID=UPI00216A8825|nr:nucleotidyl transferase AbiEii/AbiGii toxin family protein [Mycetocola sp. BIGb0189]MCS4275189.1 hypothetical protein [Mycetocola sp. BIGb0189]
MSSELVYRRVQALARSTGAKNSMRAPTQEYLIRHALESFVDRLNRSRHSAEFVLKGGILLGAYGVRRPTQDVDSNAIGSAVSPENLSEVVREIAGLDIDDGVEFNLESLTIREIREDAEYPGLRVRVGVRIASWRGIVSWDVSTGDPIVPPPRMITLERIFGEPIVMLGFAAESTVAENGITILERGLANTRWRDYVDIVALGRRGLDGDALLLAVRAVAKYRRVKLEPVSETLRGYGALQQARWSAWRRKEGLESDCELDLDEQVARVALILDPIFARGGEE